MRMHLQTFGSFKDCTFDLPMKPGLYLMGGDNGAGKSSIWAALYWLLYAKTPKGLRAGDAANWDATTARVSLDYNHDSLGAGLQAVRSWSPNLWRLTDMATGETWDLGLDKENELLAIVGMNSQAFLNCVLMSQKEPMFLDLKPEAKAVLIGEILDLGRYLELSALAGQRANAHEKQANAYAIEMASLGASLSAKQEAHDQMLRSQAQHDKERKARIDVLRGELQSTSTEIDALEKKQCAIKIPDDKEAHSRLKESRTVLHNALGIVQDVRTQLRLAEKRLKLFHDHIQCPTCGQALEDANDIQQNLEREATSLKELMEVAGVEVREAVLEVERLDQGWRELDRAIARTTSELEALQRHKQNLVRSKNKLLDKIEDEQQASSPMPDGRELKELWKKLDQAARDLDHEQAQQHRHDFWVKGFKDLRLQQIALALSELEIETNNSLSDLGLNGWEIRFDVDRETKGGTVQRGFAVTVMSPHNKRPVPWEAWSGGESQRLRISCNMGLANLIRSRTGCQLNLEVWDEPEQGLSAQGVTDLMETLKARSLREQRPIWVVSHRAMSFGEFDGVCGVVKGSEGSRIEWET